MMLTMMQPIARPARRLVENSPQTTSSWRPHLSAGPTANP